MLLYHLHLILIFKLKKSFDDEGSLMMCMCDLHEWQNLYVIDIPVSVVADIKLCQLYNTINRIYIMYAMKIRN